MTLFKRNKEISHRIYESLFDTAGKKGFEDFKDIIKNYTTGHEFFFSMYRKHPDLTNDEFNQNEQAIFDYFNQQGEITRIDSFTSIGRLPNNEDTLDFCLKLFATYIETVFFTSNLSWQEYLNNYMPISSSQFIEAGLGNTVMGCVDHGSLMFVEIKNSAAYAGQNKEEMYEE